MRKVKFLHIFIFTFLIFMALNIKTVKAASSVREVPANYVEDASYAWSFKFINGKTTLEPIGFTTAEEDLWRLDFDDTFITYTSNDQEVLRLTGDTQKGKVGAWYHNVGTYKGKEVSMKILVENWEGLGKDATFHNDDTNVDYIVHPCIFFSKTDIDVLTTRYPLVYRPTFSIAFYYSDDLNNPISLKGHVSTKDTDNREYIELDISKFESVFVTGDTNLEVIDISNTVKRIGSPASGDNGEVGLSVEPSNQKNWISFVFDTSKFPNNKLTFIYSDKIYDDSFDENVVLNNKKIYQWLLGNNSLVRYDTPEIFKQVDKSSLTKGEELTYIVDFYTPPFPNSSDYYERLTVTDNIPSELEVVSVTIQDEADNDVSGKFNITRGNNLKIEAKSGALRSEDFYNINYRVKVKCKIKDDATFSNDKIENGNYIIKNKAEIETEAGKKTSDEVTTKIYFKIDTKITNGEITPSSTNLLPGSNNTVTYVADENYYVASVIVDGQSKDVEEMLKEGAEYFNNLSDNHEVVVVCEKIPSTVVAKYVDIDTNEEIINSVKIEGYVGEEYSTEEKEIDNYVFVEFKGEKDGIFGEEDSEVIYYYKKVEPINVKTGDINVILFVTILILSVVIFAKKVVKE